MRQPALRHGRPVWLDRKHSPTTYAALRGRHDADVAIVGGGMTGAMVAATFAEAGVDVTVVEARRAGLGSTAASTALLLQEPDYALAPLSRMYGASRAARIWRISHDTTRQFLDTIRRLKIRCSVHRRDSIYYTLDDDRARELERELRRRHDARFDGEWLGPAALERHTGIHGAGAIRTSGNARLNPVLACRGLLTAAVKMGAHVFERSDVARIRRHGERVRLSCNGGTIDARHVVIATGYATKYFRPLVGRFRMRHTYVLASDRIGRPHRHQLGLDDVLLWDTARPYHYVRWTDDGRLMMGGEDRPVRPGASHARQFAAATRELREYFEHVFPALSEVRIARAWDGLFAVTPDGLPYIGPHRRYPLHAFALGYGGNGMTFAALAARILLEQWRGIVSPDHQLFAFNRTRRGGS